jgi:hypothetical protein
MLAFDFAVNDQITQRKIMMFGSKIWIDITGKKKKRRGVMFPIGMKEFEGMAPQGNMQGEMKRDPNKQGGDMFNERKHKMANRMKTIEIIGIYDELNGLINTWMESNIFAAVEFDELGMMYYRIEIPFSILNLDYELLKYTDISLIFESGYLDINEMQNKGMHPGGRPPGGGMRPGDGPPDRNSPGDLNGERMQMLQKMTEQEKFRLKGIRLF